MSHLAYYVILLALLTQGYRVSALSEEEIRDNESFGFFPQFPAIPQFPYPYFYNNDFQPYNYSFPSLERTSFYDAISYRDKPFFYSHIYGQPFRLLQSQDTQPTTYVRVSHDGHIGERTFIDPPAIRRNSRTPPRAARAVMTHSLRAHPIPPENLWNAHQNAPTQLEPSNPVRAMAPPSSFTPHSGMLPFDVSLLEAAAAESEARRSRRPPSAESTSASHTPDYSSPTRFPPIGDGATPDPANGTFAYCYPFTYDEVKDKCIEAAAQNAVGVYVGMTTETREKQEPVWYAKLRELKKESGLLIVGIAYEKPDWNLITKILSEEKGLFAGVMVEWVGPHACFTEIESPSDAHLESIQESTTHNIIRYFVRDQNFALCQTQMPLFVNDQSLVDEGALDFPEYIQPVFACTGGQEGLCYRAFHKHPEEACSDKQRFSINPYEAVGGRMMHLMNETCNGMPSHDLYGTI